MKRLLVITPIGTIWLAVAVCVAASCHFGRPPAIHHNYTVGDIDGLFVQPGLDDSIRRALIRVVSSHSMSGAGPPISVNVMMANDEMVGVGGSGRVYRVALALLVSVPEPEPRQLTVAGERHYEVGDGQPIDVAMARSRAFDALCIELMDDALIWLASEAQ